MISLNLELSPKEKILGRNKEKKEDIGVREILF